MTMPNDRAAQCLARLAISIVKQAVACSGVDLPAAVAIGNRHLARVQGGPLPISPAAGRGTNADTPRS
jgi:hypothetical protein